MESEYKSTYGSFFNQQLNNNISERFQEKDLKKVENDPDLNKSKSQEIIVEQKYDPEYLVNRYYKIHPEKDKIGYRKYYDKLKSCKVPEKTTYNEFFNKTGAYLPKISDYMEAINNMAYIVETDDIQRKNIFSERIKKEQELNKVSPIIVEEDKKIEDDKQSTTEEVEDELNYTPLELSMYAVNLLRKKDYLKKYSPIDLSTIRFPKTF